jgi:3-hydroxypropanoate dehydrogenase
VFKDKEHRFVEASVSTSTGLSAETIDEEFFAGTGYRTLVVVNIGKPGENAWFPRGPRLDQDIVVTTT